VEHDAVLVLESGPDRSLKRLAVWLTMAGMAAFLLSPASLAVKISGCLLCLFVHFYLKRQDLANSHFRLLLYPDGRARWRNRHKRWCEGVIAEHAWSSGRYAVVTGRSGRRSQHFLISRSRQQAGSYRILMAWLRLKFRHQSMDN